MNKIELAPDQGYKIEFGADTYAADSEFVLGYGLAVPENAHRVAVTWTANPAQYNYLMQMYRAHEASGHEPVLIDLFIDSSTVQERIVSILPGSFGLQSVEGDCFTVGSILEVRTQ